MNKYLFYYLGIFTLVLGFYIFYAWSNLAGNDFVYAIDDAYIHLAISRNFAEFGSWSVNPDSFDSASSSILYTFILAGLIKLFGVNLYYPLVVNIVAAYATVYWVFRYFNDFYSKQELMLGLILFLPMSLLYAMVILGMEHSIHMFLIVYFIYVLRQNMLTAFDKKYFGKLMLILFFLSLVRFESLFLLAILVFCYCFIGKWKQAFIMVIVGILPIVVFGLVSLYMGGYFFPNSLMMKAKIPGGTNVFLSFWKIFEKGILLNLNFYKYFLFPYIIILLYWNWKCFRKVSLLTFIKNEMVSIIVVAISIMQALFGFISWRYECYIMIALLLVIVPMIINLMNYFSSKSLDFQKTGFYAVVFMLFGLSFYRFSYQHSVARYASKNIEEQQLEMARFLKKYYKGTAVAANDIGAMSYFSGVKVLDLVGLGSTEVTTFKNNAKNTPSDMFDRQFSEFSEEFIKSNNSQVAVLYPKWFENSIPKNLIPVAYWTISHRASAAVETVVWYATSPQNSKLLIRNLKSFNLNKNVKQVFY